MSSKLSPTSPQPQPMSSATSCLLLRLPNELILDIAECLCAQALCNLWGTCTTLHSLLTPVLHLHANYIGLCSARKNLREPLIFALDLGAILPNTLVENSPPRRPSETHQLLIREAVSRGLDQVVSVLLDREPGDLENTRDYASSIFHSDMARYPRTTILHLAVIAQHENIAADLLARGANVNAICGSRKTPLVVAVEKSSVPLAKLLVDAGADVNAVSHSNSTVLLMAVQRGCAEMVRLLLETGQINWNGPTSPYQRGIVHTAVRKGDLTIVRLLVEYGASLNRLVNGITPLQECVRSGRLDMMKVLLDAGALVDKPSANKSTALMMAVGKANVEMVRMLAGHPQDLRWMQAWDWNPVRRRALRGALERTDGDELRRVLEEEARGWRV